MNLILLFLMATIGKSLELTIASSAFENNELIPVKYSCDGEGINPPLTITAIPEETKSLVIIMDDPDATKGTFDHWVIWNISPQETIKENSAPGIQGKNGLGGHKYMGPCPPNGTHRYFFKVYALDTYLNLTNEAGKKEVEKAMESHVLAKGQLIGLYKKEEK